MGMTKGPRTGSKLIDESHHHRHPETTNHESIAPHSLVNQQQTAPQHVDSIITTLGRDF